MTMEHFDFIIIGAGIAGASASMRLSEYGSVVLLERESQPGYHATGRSAATYEPSYGPEKVLRLIKASKPFLDHPPTGFMDTAILSPRGMMTLFRENQGSEYDEFMDILGSIGSGFEKLDAGQALKRVPILNPDYYHRAIYSDEAKDIDVHGLHQGYLRAMKALGGKVQVNAEVREISRTEDWTVTTRSGRFSSPVIINASGAWADEIAVMAGVKPIGLEPRRRCALLASLPQQYDIRDWPLVMGLDPSFYFKPDAGRLMISPEDSHPSAPCDARPEDIDIAYAIDRFERATTVSIRRPEHTWAGLRSFVADEMMVAGFDAQVDGFFWLVGQGGFGIKTSPAMSLITGQLARGKDFPQSVADCGLSEADLSPSRAGCG